MSLTSQNKISAVEYIILIFAVLFGNSIAFNIKIGPAYITIYRLTIPAILLVLFICKNKRFFSVVKSSPFICFMIFWIMYAMGMTIINGGLNISDSLKEIGELIYGMMIVTIMGVSVDSKERYEKFTQCVKMFVVLLCFLGMVEICTGYHLTTCRLMNDIQMNDIQYGLIHGTKGIAFGNCYNENDFCVCLIFLWIVGNSLYSGDQKLNAILGIIILGITYVDDANIVLISIALSFGVVMLIVFGKKINRKLLARFIAILLMSLSVFATNIGDSLVLRLEKQIFNFKNSCGSMYYRVELMKESLTALYDSHFIGLGPAGIKDYLAKNSITRYDNPHNFWMEMLGNYGIIVTFVLIAQILFYMKQIYMYYKRTKEKSALIKLAGLCVFCIACTAPSTFINKCFQWLFWGDIVVYYKIVVENSQYKIIQEKN